MGPFKKYVHCEGVGGTPKMFENVKGERGLQSLPRKNSACTVIHTCGKIIACDVV